VRRSVDATTVSVMGIVSVIGSAYIAMMDSVLCGFPYSITPGITTMPVLS